MPTYEMPLLIQLGKKTEYANVLKDVAMSIFKTGGFIRKIENWGNKTLPCKAYNHGKTHLKAGHFMLRFDMPPSEVIKFQDNCNRHISIVRSCIYLQNVPYEGVQCTFEEESLPAVYRPSVQKILELSKKHSESKIKFKYNSGLDYYPFLK